MIFSAKTQERNSITAFNLVNLFIFTAIILSGNFSLAEEAKEYTHRENWDIKKPEEFLTSPTPNDAVSFYKNGIRKYRSIRFFPNANQPKSNYYLELTALAIGSGGHAIASLYDYSKGKAKRLGSAGMYTTNSDGDIKTSTSIGTIPINFDIQNVHAKYPDLINFVLNYHEGLQVYFGTIPPELSDTALNDLTLVRTVIQLNDEQHQKALTLIQSRSLTEKARADLMTNWNEKIAYTSMTTNELKNYSKLEKLAYDFFEELFSIINFDMPYSQNYDPAWPIIVYSVNPTIGGSKLITIDKTNKLKISFLETDISYTSGENSIDIVEKYDSFKEGVSSSGLGEHKKYYYKRTKRIVPPKTPSDFGIEYHLKEYVGEINGENMPHGKGILETDSRTYMGRFVNGFPDGEIDIYVKGTHVATKTFSSGIPHGPYIYYSYGEPTQEGWYNDGVAHVTREFAYPYENGKPVGSSKHIIDYIYSPEGEITSKKNTHSKRAWTLDDGRKLYTDQYGKALLVFENGDALSGPYEYINYDKNQGKPSYAASGRFHGECSYYAKEDSRIIEGDYDKENARFKNGDIKFTFYDGTLKEHVTRNAKYKDGEITVRKTNVIDALFQGLFQYLESGKIDFYITSLRSISAAGGWLETALGTSIPKLAFTDEYSWEDEYYTSQEIREQTINDNGYEFKPTPYEDLQYINREYTMKYNGKDVVIKMTLPLEGTVIVRNEQSGIGYPDSKRNRDRNKDGIRDPHEAYDYLSVTGQKIISPVDGVIVHQGYHQTGSYLRTIWIDTRAETGETVRVKIFYGKLDPDVATDLRNIPLNERMQGGGIPTNRGDGIASAQSLDDWYNTNPADPFVSDHIHMEVHIREDHMKWRASAKVSKPPFLIPPAPIPRIENNKK